MSAIHYLIAQISDPRLRERLAAEWAIAAKDKKFGLVFEDHLPELLPLHGAKPRKGDLVCRRQGALKDVWQVKSLNAGVATCVKPSNEAHPSEPTRAATEPVQLPVEELLVVREFGEPIFPALVPVDAVANGPVDSPWHTLIEADTRDAVAAVVRDRPNALIVDFFAGSGTTLNAVNLLNATDGGQRRCILVNIPRLWVIDGSKALRSGIEQMCGKDARVQRCRIH